jgi:glutaminyl-peptide cyclotransferase
MAKRAARDRKAGRGGPRRPAWVWGGLLVTIAVLLLGAALLVGGRRESTPPPSPAASAGSAASGGLATAPAIPAAGARTEVERLTLLVKATHPHDPECYTQGLVWQDGELYESCGLYGKSSLRRVDPSTGAVRRQVEVPAADFAEGLALVGERLLQLTWREGTLLSYDRKSFARTGETRYEGEGWGLCYDGRRLVMSDGSDRLSLRDPQSFAKTGEIQVTRDGIPVEQLNELECVGGAIWANVWQTDEILRIDPATGHVTGALDAAGLLSPAERQHTDVLNGIAWDPAKRRFWITGKLWPKMFEAEILPDPARK